MAPRPAVAHLQAHSPRMAKNMPRFHYGELAQAQPGVGESGHSPASCLVNFPFWPLFINGEHH